MQYEEVLNRAPFSEQQMLELCIKSGKTPREFMKDYLKMASGLTDWRLAHREYGVLTNLEQSAIADGKVVLTATYQGRPSKYGDGTQTGRTKIIQSTEAAEKLYQQWSSYLNQSCVFYISYQENKEDGSVYRVLMDIDGPETQAPVPLVQNAPAATGTTAVA